MLVEAPGLENGVAPLLNDKVMIHGIRDLHSAMVRRDSHRFAVCDLRHSQLVAFDLLERWEDPR
jgi:hypothetical protein